MNNSNQINYNQINNTNQNINSNNVKKDNDSKKILSLIVMIAVLMVTTTGATYAYFAISASATNNITGTAATGAIIMTNGTATTAGVPALIAPTSTTYNTLPMVPQISYTGTTNVLQKAFNGASGKDKCVDANGNVICRAYTFAVRNNSTSSVDVRGSITFTASTFHNLRWKLMDSATAVTVSSATAGTSFSATAPIKAVHNSKVYFDTTNVALTPNGGTKQYWLIVWIEEINRDQGANGAEADRDTGTWYATIEFSAFNEAGSAIGGITSTITS